jgi:predicted acetylornithine/succinylornithine family transaminase
LKTPQEYIEVAQKSLTQNYRQQPVVLDRGKGSEVWDVSGKRYLDLTGGIAACPLGHGHAGLAAAIAAQASKLIHVSNLFYNEAQIRLADKLTQLASELGSPRAFFCNSGAEANEAALKLVKRYQTTVRGKPERIEVFAFEGSFHGRSIATVALTGQEKYRAGFGPLIEWGRFLPWPESADDPRVLGRIGESTCAVIIEPIQAEGGIRVPPAGFLAALRKRCSDTGTVLIFDEVQTGAGRTGRYFGYEDAGVVPDVISLAKGLAGGVPIGAILASGELSQGFAPGTHASTFGGNPLACASALAVIEAIEKDDLLARVRAAGERLAAGLERVRAKHASRAKEVRGRGLLRGLLVDGDAAPVVQKVRDRGVLLSVAGSSVVRFVPPFIVSDSELDEGIAALDQALGESL